MADEVDERKVAAVQELVHRLVRAGHTENVEALREAAERLEIELMVEHLPGAEKRLFRAAAEFLAHCVERRGGPHKSLLDQIGQALADED